ncbi:unnamed protein product [Phytophthora fragariaefolia]|uniref:Unnamed protein product n=1 Tax=Phytophthora fragariaefolia TaxID=1490495 RepID=A0A9W6WTQ0_9STRA|nr:unnamed protein product [Phytophthora fragariaefolia]
MSPATRSSTVTSVHSSCPLKTTGAIPVAPERRSGLWRALPSHAAALTKALAIANTSMKRHYDTNRTDVQFHVNVSVHIGILHLGLASRAAGCSHRGSSVPTRSQRMWHNPNTYRISFRRSLKDSRSEQLLVSESIAVSPSTRYGGTTVASATRGNQHST